MTTPTPVTTAEAREIADRIKRGQSYGVLPSVRQGFDSILALLSLADQLDQERKCNAMLAHDHHVGLARIEKLVEERDAAVKARDHWKANHDNQVAIKHAVLDRPDLGDQSRSVLALTAERDELRAALTAQVGSINVIIEPNEVCPHCGKVNHLP